MPQIIAFIPARKGSKRVPGKNLRPLMGKPLVAWAIEAAKMCSYEMLIHVSTDCSDIADVAKKHGAMVPFLRSKEYASDESHQHEAFEETIVKYRYLGMNFDYAINLQPTSPLRSNDDIDKALQYLIENKKNHIRSVVSVSEVSKPLDWSVRLDEDGSMSSFVRKAKKLNLRSQDATPTYALDGAIYAGHISDILKHKSFYIPVGRVQPLVMPANRSIDIDTEFDLKLAEFLLNQQI